MTLWCHDVYMKRTNIYLEEEQLRHLKHIAVEEGLSFTELVRRALGKFIESYESTEKSGSYEMWSRRFDQLLDRVHERTRSYPSEEIESELTSAADSRRKLAKRSR
jgi:hypothetical protein